MARSKSFLLTHEERTGLKQVLRQRKADGLIVRRANALLLLDDGIGAIEVARVLYLDAETIPRDGVVISPSTVCGFCISPPIRSVRVIFLLSRKMN